MRHLNFSKYMVAGLMAASLLTTNTSCADYLDKEPDTELDIEMVFSNRDKVYQWLAFVYNTIHEPDKWRIWKDGYEVFADDLTPSKRWEQWDGKTTIPKIFGEWTVNSMAIFGV